MGQRSQPPQVNHIGHSCHLTLDPATYIIRSPHTYFNLQHSGWNLWDLLLQHVHEPDRLLHGRSPKEESWILPPSSVHPLRLPQALCLLPVRQACFKELCFVQKFKSNFFRHQYDQLCASFSSAGTHWSHAQEHNQGGL